MFSVLDLKVSSISLSLSVTVHWKEFQTTRAEQQKSRLVKAVLDNGSDSTVAVNERRIHTLSQDVMCRHAFGKLLSYCINIRNWHYSFWSTKG